MPLGDTFPTKPRRYPDGDGGDHGLSYRKLAGQSFREFSIMNSLLHYPQAMLSDDLVAEAVNEKVETFYRNVRTRRVAADGSLGQIAVLFTQKRSKKTWFSSTEVRGFLSIALGPNLK